MRPHEIAFLFLIVAIAINILWLFEIWMKEYTGGRK